MNHNEFMRRALTLLPRAASRASAFEGVGQRYLAATRSQPVSARIAGPANAVLLAFRHFMQEYVRFDCGSETSHGALCRHIKVDDRVLPLWGSFRDQFVEAKTRPRSPSARGDVRLQPTAPVILDEHRRFAEYLHHGAAKQYAGD